MAAEVAQPQRADVRSPRPPRPLAMLWWSLGLVAAFALMGLLVAQDAAAPFTQPLDDWWRGLVGVGPDSGLYPSALPMFFQHLGEGPGALVGMILIPGALAFVGRWRSALFFLTVTLVGPGLFSQGMKNLVDRPRPAADETLGLFGPLFRVDHGSFPSGHAVSAGILIIAVAAVLPPAKRRVWWFIGALIGPGMIWQRTLINAHWFSDAVFGVLGGASATLIIWWAFSTLLAKDYGKPLFRRADPTTGAPQALPAS